jgi:hypothetical protein
VSWLTQRSADGWQAKAEEEIKQTGGLSVITHTRWCEQADRETHRALKREAKQRGVSVSELSPLDIGMPYDHAGRTIDDYGIWLEAEPEAGG